MKGKRIWDQWLRIALIVVFTGLFTAALAFAVVRRQSKSLSAAPVQDEDSTARFESYLAALASQEQAEHERYANLLADQQNRARFESYLAALASQEQAENERYASLLAEQNLLADQQNRARFESYLEALRSMEQAEHKRFAAQLEDERGAITERP